MEYLVNNAGFGQMSLFEDTTKELFDKKLLPLMADGGAIVNTTSNSALVSGTEPGYSAYASMKGGLIVLTRYMAKEFSKQGIRVNTVAPGPTRTRISDNAFERFPEVIPALAAKTALAAWALLSPGFRRWADRSADGVKRGIPVPGHEVLQIRKGERSRVGGRRPCCPLRGAADLARRRERG